MSDIVYGSFQPISGPSVQSLSKFFISKINEKAQLGIETGFDFTFEHIQYLCEIEPENCENLLETLSLTATKPVQVDNQEKKPAKTDPIDKKEVKNGTKNIISEKEDIEYVTTVDTTYPSDGLTAFGVPRHILILGLIPFFPVMLLFTVSGGAAFFATTAIEFVLRFVVDLIHRPFILLILASCYQKSEL